MVPSFEDGINRMCCARLLSSARSEEFNPKRFEFSDHLAAAPSSLRSLEKSFFPTHSYCWIANHECLAQRCQESPMPREPNTLAPIVRHDNLYRRKDITFAPIWRYRPGWRLVVIPHWWSSETDPAINWSISQRADVCGKWWGKAPRNVISHDTPSNSLPFRWRHRSYNLDF